jgi:hypothetical protein
MVRKILVGAISVLTIIQFIRPARNESASVSPNDITLAYPVPEQVQTILKTSCYNCHSNNTTYPWYANVQPVGWWMQKHVNDAKKELNFSEFGTYPEKRAKHKFDEMVDEVSEGEMPLKSYLMLHAEAKMTPEQSKALTDWAGALK